MSDDDEKSLDQEIKLAISPEMILETLCCECLGKGGHCGDYPDNKSYYPCHRCEDTGYVLTDAGEATRGFLQRMYKRCQYQER